MTCYDLFDMDDLLKSEEVKIILTSGRTHYIHTDSIEYISGTNLKYKKDVKNVNKEYTSITSIPFSRIEELVLYYGKDNEQCNTM